LQAQEDDVDQAAEFKIDLQYDRHTSESWDPAFGCGIVSIFFKDFASDLKSGA
jgi:hypothetical protein